MTLFKTSLGGWVDRRKFTFAGALSWKGFLRKCDCNTISRTGYCFSLYSSLADSKESSSESSDMLKGCN